MHTTVIYQQVEKSLAHFLTQGKTVFSVALSGGVDSVVLLHLMHALKKAYPQIDVSAIYVNHGLSDQAQHWQEFCQTLCAQLNITFQSISVHIEPQTRTSLEAQARAARYKALDELSPNNSIILLAQHLTDQVETFLLRLKRGSGLKGLGAMHQQRSLKSGKICFRPLINTKRIDIESFAQQFNIHHITDDSNNDERFDRNFLRSQVVPLLASRFTGFEQCVGRSVELLQQQQILLDEYVQSDLQQCLVNQHALCIAHLNQYSMSRIANITRAWLELFTHVMPSQKQLMQIIDQAINAQSDAQICIDLVDGQIRRHQGCLYFVTPKPLLVEHSLDNNELILADGRLLIKRIGTGIRHPRADEQVTVRFNCNSARIKPLKKPGSNTLKHWFKDAKVAPWLRTTVPLIFYNDELVQVVGYFISEKHHDEQGIFWECN